jgi:uncharacterized protein (TIGR03000 family)
MIRQCVSRIGLPAVCVAALLLWVGTAPAQRGGGGGHGGGGGGGHASFAGGGHAGSFSQGGGSWHGGNSWHNGNFHHDDHFGHHDHDRFFFGFGVGYPYWGWGYGWPYTYGWPGYYGGYYGPYYDDPYYYAPSINSAYPPAADYYAGPSSPAPALATGPVTPGSTPNPNVAHLRVMVPADAKVWFEDEQTGQNGPARYFTSPELALDKEYVYQIKAEWQEDGHAVSRERRVMLHAGDWITVDFNRTSKGETLPPPKATN